MNFMFCRQRAPRMIVCKQANAPRMIVRTLTFTPLKHLGVADLPITSGGNCSPVIEVVSAKVTRRLSIFVPLICASHFNKQSHKRACQQHTPRPHP